MINKNFFINYDNKDLWNFIFSIIFILLVIIFSNFILKKGILIKLKYFDFLLISIATFRMIRLFTYDKIMSFFRKIFEGKKNGLLNTIHELLICPWCTGIWAALIILALYSFSFVGKILVIILAIAGVGSFIQILANMISRIGNK